MIDLVMLRLKAGDGGNGLVSFRHEKYVPKGGPDGGNGGNGGRVILRATRSLSTLRDLAGVNLLEAEKGENGGRRKRFGEKGKDRIIEVPVGTVVWVLAENAVSHFRGSKYGFANQKGKQRFLKRSDYESTDLEKQSGLSKYYVEKEGHGVPHRDLDRIDPEIVKSQAARRIHKEYPEIFEKKEELFSFLEDGQQLVICQGGTGGRGNTAFKGSTNTTPLEAEYGGFGEEKIVQLELKLLADLALVGFPNAGKSTLLSKVTRANPKIANYPFTTLEPNLGILYLGKGYQKDEVVLADIPGLVEGASQGKGLGLDFLRHIENCQALLYVLALPEHLIFDEGLAEQRKAEILWHQYLSLQGELKAYNPELLEKPQLLSINKIDIYSAKQISTFRSIFEEKNMNVILFSGITGDGLAELKKALAELLQIAEQQRAATVSKEDSSIEENIATKVKSPTKKAKSTKVAKTTKVAE